MRLQAISGALGEIRTHTARVLKTSVWPHATSGFRLRDVQKRSRAGLLRLSAVLSGPRQTVYDPVRTALVAGVALVN